MPIERVIELGTSHVPAELPESDRRRDLPTSSTYTPRNSRISSSIFVRSVRTNHITHLRIIQYTIAPKNNLNPTRSALERLQIHSHNDVSPPAVPPDRRLPHVGFAVTGGPEHSPAYNLGRGYADKASFDDANSSLYIEHLVHLSVFYN